MTQCKWTNELNQVGRVIVIINNINENSKYKWTANSKTMQGNNECNFVKNINFQWESEIRVWNQVEIDIRYKLMLFTSSHGGYDLDNKLITLNLKQSLGRK